MRLFHSPRSRSIRVLWALEEAGAPVELVFVPREQRQTEEHLARQPLGRVPAAEDDEGFLFESAALCLHVADSYPDARLIGPIGSHERALAYQWVCFALTEIEPNIVDFMRSWETDPQRAEAARERFRAAAEVIERALEGCDYLIGDRFTVADIICGELLHVSRRHDLAAGLRNANAYIERLRARPALQRAEAAEPA
jgi:glutathione S-transferase